MEEKTYECKECGINVEDPEDIELVTIESEVDFGIDELLNKDGLLCIAVPNYTSFDAKYYKQNWAAYDVPRHLYHFSPQAMQILFEKYEYSIIDYKQLPFDPFYIALLSELSVIKSKNIIRAFWIGLRSYIKGLFNAKQGSSVLYILKRKG